jgi:hypothetical protein
MFQYDFIQFEEEISQEVKKGRTEREIKEIKTEVRSMI